MSESSPIAGIVEVRIPADVVFVATLRLVAASLAVRCDLTVDDIEDLRLAVDEASALLLPLASGDAGATIDARFAPTDGRLDVAVSVRTAEHATVDRSGFAWTVLTALASEVSIDSSEERCTITVTKRREVAQR